MTVDWKWISLVAFLLLLSISNLLNQHWYGDIWEHAAVIKALAESPWAPAHPLLEIEASHVFYSPYHLFLGLVSKISGISPIRLLQAFGFFNLLLFLFGFHRFVRSLSSHVNAPFWALSCSLFLWTIPYSFSGYFHVTGVVSFSALPSTFATGISLLILAQYHKSAPSISGLQLLAMALGSLLVFLVHPFTAVVLYTGVIAVSVHHFEAEQLKRLIATALVIIVLPILIGLLWPYFSMWDLLRGESTAFHESNRPTYDSLIVFLAALILLVPCLLVRAKRRWNDLLFWFFLGLSFLYLYGLISQQFSYGRMGSYMAMIVQISVGIYMAEEAGNASRNARLYRYFILGLLGLFVLRFAPAIKRMLPGAGTDTIYRYQQIAEALPADAIVLSDKPGGFPLPAFKGKIVCSDHALAFVPDHQERRESVAQFHNKLSGTEQRKAILKKYRVSHVLVNHSAFEFKSPGIPMSYVILNVLRNLVGLSRIHSPAESMDIEHLRELDEMRGFLQSVGTVIAEGQGWELFLVSSD